MSRHSILHPLKITPEMPPFGFWNSALLPMALVSCDTNPHAAVLL
jgi:hypothetical protein